MGVGRFDNFEKLTSMFVRGAHEPPNFAPEHQRTVKLQFPEFFDKKWSQAGKFLNFHFFRENFQTGKNSYRGLKFFNG